MRGGKRAGSGRKPSGKRKIVMYGTADEEAILRKKLLELRQESPLVEDKKEEVQEIKIAEVETICRPKVCPDCGNSMKIKSGSRGDFWGCSGYPNCRHTESI